MQPRDQLTQKEIQVATLVWEGLTNRDIAKVIGTSEQVVKNYLRTTFDKLGVWSRLELALYVASHGGVNWVSELGLENKLPVPTVAASSVAKSETALTPRSAEPRHSARTVIREQSKVPIAPSATALAASAWKAVNKLLEFGAVLVLHFEELNANAGSQARVSHLAEDPELFLLNPQCQTDLGSFLEGARHLDEAPVQTDIGNASPCSALPTCGVQLDR